MQIYMKVMNTAPMLYLPQNTQNDRNVFNFLFY